MILQRPKDKAPLSVVWSVSPGRDPEQTIGQLQRWMSADESFRLTVALPANMILRLNESQSARLMELEAGGQLELAVSPKGSLPLPLLGEFHHFLKERCRIAEYSEQAPKRLLRDVEIARLLVATEEIWRVAFSSRALPGLAAPLGEWPNAAWTKAGHRFAWIVRISSLPITGLEPGQNLPQRYSALPWNPSADVNKLKGIVLLDETYMASIEEADSMLDDLASIAEDDDGQWRLFPLSVWNEMPALDIDSAPPPLCTPETAHSFWGSRAQANFWPLLVDLRDNIIKYQNSGRANLTILDKCWEEFYGMLDHSTSATFKEEGLLSSEASVSEESFLATLKTLYGKMAPVLKRRPRLPQSLWLDTSNGENSQDRPSRAAGAFNRLEFTDSFDDPKQNASGVNIERLIIEWSDRELIFRIAHDSAEENFFPCEIYIDLNNQAYAGKGEDWDGRRRAGISDFWEYIIRSDAQGVVTAYRYNPQGSLRNLGRWDQAVRKNEDGLEIRLPRNLIAGKNPRKWGWALCAQSLPNDASTPEQNLPAEDCLDTGGAGADTLPFVRE